MKQERAGLLLVGSALVVIGLVCGLFLTSQRDGRRAQDRALALGLLRLLASLPQESLLGDVGGRSVLDVVAASQSNEDFAYAVLSGTGGEPLAQAVAPGVLVPPAPAAAAGGAAWIGERELAGAGARAILDYHAPLVAGGQSVGQLRIGFFEPRLLPPLDEASRMGMLALPVFLLAPLAWFLIRREVRPLASTCGQLRELVESQSLHPVPIQASGELGEFVRSFNRFVELAETRSQEMQGRETRALAASKVVTYQKSRLEAVLETLPDAILLLDEAGRVSFANGKLEALLGLGREAVVSRRPGEWCDEPDLVELLARYEGPQPQLCRSETREFDSQTAPGRQLELSAFPLASGLGKASGGGTLAVLRDVTAAALARRAQGEFVTHVAHELKSPLHVMAMYSESLLGKDGESEAFRIEACNVLQDEVERVSLLVGTLLGIARIETGAVVLERQPVRLEEFLSDALEAVSRGRRDDLRFELSVPGGVPTIHVDKELFRVAVNNLLTNAIKYNREDGEVSLGVSDDGDRLAIRVRDTGLGVSEEDRRRIFEKFYRSADVEAQARGGHGLGLALAREIVELHGGEIQLESQPGQGSVFSILLRKTPALLRESMKS